jgi:tetratricopeptide (TPR) repeat protein
MARCAAISSRSTRAVELDPDYAGAYAALAATHWEIWKRYWHLHFDFGGGSSEPHYLAEQYLAQALRNPTPLAHRVRSAMLSHQHQHDAAIAQARTAVALDPNDADGYAALANALALAGEPAEALEWMERALRRNPHYPAYYLYQLGLARFVADEVEAATGALSRAVALNPRDYWASRVLVAAYGNLGRLDDAARTIEAMDRSDVRDFLRTWDPFTVRSSAYWLPFRRPADAERLARGLRAAGVPD